jgi:hypothetical protein
MSQRTIRRAAERKARKEARKAAQNDSLAAAATAFTNPIPPIGPPTDISDFRFSTAAITANRLEANRANAQFSTGPKTEEGKAISSHNALKTGLTGQTVLLPTDDEAAYQRHVEGYLQQHKPVGQQESDLVQTITDIAWRLKRIPLLEKMIYLRGRKEFANMFPDSSPADRAGLIELHTYEMNEKKLRNLSLQESRLSRRSDKALAELRRLQKERMTNATEALKDAARLYLAAQNAGKPWDPQHHGFEFSLDAIRAFIANIRTKDMNPKVGAQAA